MEWIWMYDTPSIRSTMINNTNKIIQNDVTKIGSVSKSTYEYRILNYNLLNVFYWYQWKEIE